MIDKLKIIASLPKELLAQKAGMVAGSWVAAEIFKQLRLPINPVANDIDFFVLTKHQENGNEVLGLNVDAVKGRGVGTASFGSKAIACDHYGHLTATFIPDYKLVSSKRLQDSNINIVSVTMSSQNPYQRTDLDRIVSNFDINAIQVGIDISTGELFGTYRFWEFCRTMQLEIVNFFTPTHSIIRYFKKKRELGCYGDNEFNSIATKSVMNNYGHRSMNSFGAETAKKFKSEQDLLSKFGFSMQEEAKRDIFKIMYKSSDGKIFDENEVNIIFSPGTYHKEIVKVGEIDYTTYKLEAVDEKQYVQNMYEMFFDRVSLVESKKVENESTRSSINGHYGEDGVLMTTSIHPKEVWSLVNLIYRGRKNDVSFFKSMARSKFEGSERVLWATNTMGPVQLLGKPSLLIGLKNKHSKIFAPLENFSKESPSMAEYAGTTIQKADDLILIEKFLREIKIEFGEDVVGVLEYQTTQSLRLIMPTLEELKSNNYNRSFEVINKVIEEFKKSEQFIQKSFGVLGHPFFTIEDLTSRAELFAEGSKQKHCVAGYYSLVQSGKCRIISVRHKTQARITFEVRPVSSTLVEKQCWEVVQSKLKFNESPDEKHLAAAIKAINESSQGEMVFTGSLLKFDEWKALGFNSREWLYPPREVQIKEQPKEYVLPQQQNRGPQFEFTAEDIPF